MRRVGRWVRRIAAVSISAGIAGCGGGSGHGAAITSFGRMAGYVWSGEVTSVRAAWSVPRMTSGFGEAHASTWIGAQALGVPARSPFIQAGTTEDRGPASRPVYAAFWTDTKRGYHPQVLFHVRPGDEVTTSLTLAAGRWQVVIADATSGRRAAFLTREEGKAAFNLAEWLQEDPSETSGKATPYPALSEVRMSHLAANGAPPRYADMYAQWMSVGGASLAPTPVRDGAFSISRGMITPAGRRYLRDRSAPEHRRAPGRHRGGELDRRDPAAPDPLGQRHRRGVRARLCRRAGAGALAGRRPGGGEVAGVAGPRRGAHVRVGGPPRSGQPDGVAAAAGPPHAGPAEAGPPGPARPAPARARLRTALGLRATRPLSSVLPGPRRGRSENRSSCRTHAR